MRIDPASEAVRYICLDRFGGCMRIGDCSPLEDTLKQQLIIWTENVLLIEWYSQSEGCENQGNGKIIQDDTLGRHTLDF